MSQYHYKNIMFYCHFMKSQKCPSICALESTQKHHSTFFLFLLQSAWPFFSKVMAQTKTKDHKSVLSQVSNVQKALQEQYYRVEVLEKALAFKDMTNEEREEMEAELEAIKQLLSNNEEALKQMQLQQRKTTSVAVLAIVMCVGIFLIYSVVTNPY